MQMVGILSEAVPRIGAFCKSEGACFGDLPLAKIQA